MVGGLSFDPGLLGPTLVIAASQAGLYGLLVVALVLTFRVSRTVGFVHGGIAVVGALGYWVLTYPADSSIPGNRPELHGLVALALLVGVGVLIGAAYGATVMSRRMARLPRVTLTIFSVGAMLTLAGVMTSALYTAPNVIPPSPFGAAQYEVLGWSITRHRLLTAAFAFLLVAFGGLVLAHTRAGLHVRAIADDVEVSQWAGVRLYQVGISVYGISGGIAALSGALMTPVVGADTFNIFFLFLRALTVAVIGGFNSLALGLAGAVVLGLVDTAMRSGLVDGASLGQREMVIMAVVFALVVLISRRRPLLALADERS